MSSLRLNNEEALMSKTSFNYRAKSTTTLNPYLANMYTDRNLFAGMNQYHKLDKMGNINQNKAFAQTIFNEQVSKVSQHKFDQAIRLSAQAGLPSSLLVSKRSIRTQKAYPLS